MDYHDYKFLFLFLLYYKCNSSYFIVFEQICRLDKQYNRFIYKIITNKLTEDSFLKNRKIFHKQISFRL